MPRCSGCGQSNPEIARFCFSCGAAFAEPPASPAEARKTVTVLFADVVESTSLLDRLEPESARRVLDRFFQTVSSAVESHGGIVEKFIGDAVMAVFGIPRLHEDDALRACRAAEEIRAGLARLNAELEQTVGVTIRVRIGVNTGNVVVGDPRRGQAFVTGEAVNVAARLETAAQPGDVLIGESTFTLVRHVVSAEAIEQLQLKGKAGAVNAHRLLALGGRAPASRTESAFVGREHELVELMAEFERVRSEHASRLVTVLGTAGVGKSRLVDEFLGTCADSATILRGRCLPYGEGITFWPLKEAIGEAAGLRGDESAEAARTRIRALVGTAADGDLVVERLSETLGITEAVAEHRGSSWATRRLFEEIARAGPVVLVLDGLQWAEPTFLDLIEDLAEGTDGTPLLVLGMARPELLEARLSWAGPAGRSRQIFLEPLSAADTERLLASVLGGAALAEAAASKIVNAADGLPLFVEEMVAMLIDDGSLRREDGRWVTRRPGADRRTCLDPGVARSPPGPTRAGAAGSARARLGRRPGLPSRRGGARLARGGACGPGGARSRARPEGAHRARAGGVLRGRGLPLPPPAPAGRRLRVGAEGAAGEAARTVRGLARRAGRRADGRVRRDRRLPPGAGVPVRDRAEARRRARPRARGPWSVTTRRSRDPRTCAGRLVRGREPARARGRAPAAGQRRASEARAQARRRAARNRALDAFGPGRQSDASGAGRRVIAGS